MYYYESEGNEEENIFPLTDDENENEIETEPFLLAHKTIMQTPPHMGFTQEPPAETTCDDDEEEEHEAETAIEKIINLTKSIEDIIG